MIEAARKEERISINRACKILGINRTGYYRKVYGLCDYRKKDRMPATIEPLDRQAIYDLSVNNPEYGHKKIWALMNYRHGIGITEIQDIQRDAGNATVTAL